MPKAMRLHRLGFMLGEAGGETVELAYGEFFQAQVDELTKTVDTTLMALSEMMNTLASLSSNVHTLATEVQSLKWIFGIGLAVLAVLIALFSLMPTILSALAKSAGAS